MLEQFFDDEYDGASAGDWVTPPAHPDGPENLFDHFPVYLRPALMLEGYREIVGDTRFFTFAKDLQTTFAYGAITRQEFVDTALENSGLSGAQLTLLGDYFDQWLLGTVKPDLTPDDFP